MKRRSLLALWLRGIALLLCAETAQAQTDPWVPIGPFVANITALAAGADGLLYAGTDEGLVYRSADGGNTWTLELIEDERRVSALLATNAGDGFAVFTSRELFHSSDGGQTWISRGTLGMSVAVLAEDGEGRLFAGGSDGVMRSLDQGQTWEGFAVGIDERVKALVVDAQGHLYAGTSDGLFYSSNHGETWSLRGLGDDINALVIDRQGHLYAGTRDGLLRSTDEALTWELIPTTMFLVDVRALAVAPDGTVYAAVFAEGVGRVNSSEPLLVGFDNSLNNETLEALAVAATGALLAGSRRNAVFRSTDAAETWEHASTGITPARVRAITFGAGRQVFAATSLGLYRSSDFGQTWSHSLSVDGHVLRSVLTFGPNEVYVGDDYRRFEVFQFEEYGDIRFSADGGRTWTRIARRLDHQVNALSVSPGGRLFAGTSRFVYRQNNQGIMNEMIRLDVQALLHIAEEQLFVAAGGGIYHSTNDGLDWEQVQDVRGQASALVLTPGGQLFAGTREQGILRSEDGGLTWAAANAGLTDTEILSLAARADGDVFAGTRTGVFRTTDGGQTWAPFNQGLTQPETRALAVDDAGRVYAATQFGGVFRSGTVEDETDPPTDTAVELLPAPADFSLAPNFPNPFTTSTTIHFRVETPGSVRLSVFDVLGREVATLVDEALGAGAYRVVFVPEELPGGVYFYRLRTPSFAETRRMLLVR